MLPLLFGFVDISGVVAPFVFWWFLPAAKFSISNLMNVSNWANEFQSSIFVVSTTLLSFRRLGFMTGFGDSRLSTVSFISIVLFTWWSLSNTSEISFCVIEAAWKDKKKWKKIVSFVLQFAPLELITKHFGTCHVLTMGSYSLLRKTDNDIFSCSNL